MVRAKKTGLAEKSLKKKAAVMPIARKKATVISKTKVPAVKPAAKKKTKLPAKKKAAKAVAPRNRKVTPPAVPKLVVLKPKIRKAPIAEPLNAARSPSPKFVAAKDVLQKKRLLRTAKTIGKTAVSAVKTTEVQEAQPVRPSFFQEVQGVLPRGYGDHFITLMICSPYQLYSYWEIQKHREAEALQVLGGRWDQVKSVLRVYNLTQESRGSFFFDLELGGGADCWFITVEPNQSYRVEIGLRHADGRFMMLARSNDVTTPRVTMSEVLDEEWMGIDFEHMYALSGGFEPGCSSVALRTLMEERLRSGDTSGSGAGMLSSGSMVKKKERNFWFTLNCELIVHGATAPDAHVTMNGQAVKLRSDGTFTLHYSLPDGKIRLEAKAVSADLIEERTITPTVQRNTERPEPVIRRNSGRG